MTNDQNPDATEELAERERGRVGGRKCPRCGSPDPKLHPAVQFEGEVQLCHHPYHAGADPTRALAERIQSAAARHGIKIEDGIALEIAGELEGRG